MSAVGEQLAWEGMAAADQAADPGWTVRWDEAIALLARRGMPFTADDVREIAGAPTDHRNAAGARFQAARNAGLIRAVGYRRSTRDVLHAHPIALWMGVPA